MRRKRKKKEEKKSDQLDDAEVSFSRSVMDGAITSTVVCVQIRIVVKKVDDDVFFAGLGGPVKSSVVMRIPAKKEEIVEFK